VIIFNSIGSRPMFLPFLSFSKSFFTIKSFHNAIIDETGIYWPAGNQFYGFCRQRKAEDCGKEGAGDADLLS
jgi:hypothetical protein